jgi:hypothetical protein
LQIKDAVEYVQPPVCLLFKHKHLSYSHSLRRGRGGSVSLLSPPIHVRCI